MGHCAECWSKQAEIDRLREELGAWQQYAGGLDADMTRLCRWKDRLGLPGQRIALLVALVDAAPRILSRAHLFDLRGAMPGSKTDDDASLKTIDVQLTRIRQRLAESGIPNAIRNVWGVGWSMDPATADAVRALAGDDVERQAA